MRREVTAIVACSDLGEAQRFVGKLGFARDEGSPDDDRMLIARRNSVPRSFKRKPSLNQHPESGGGSASLHVRNWVDRDTD